MKRDKRSNSSTRKSGFDPIITIGLVVVLVFFTISGEFAYINLRTLREDNQKIIHSHQIITDLAGLLSSMQDAETGQRGFLLTYNEKYLDPYNEAVAVIPGRLDEITQLTSDNSTQQANIGVLNRLHRPRSFGWR